MNDPIKLIIEQKTELTLIGIFILFFLIIFCILSYFIRDSALQGFAIMSVALVTSWFTILQYKNKQTTLRLQKIYFEDTLFGLINCAEEIMLITKRNLLLTENLVNLASNMVDQKSIPIEELRENLLRLFGKTAQSIEIKINITALQILRLNELITASSTNSNILPHWIEQFELDSSRFSYFLQDQISIVKIASLRNLEKSNITTFKDHVKELLFKYPERSFILIRRHEILIQLLHIIVKEFLSVDYSSIQKIQSAFENDNIKESLILINKRYKDLVADFITLDIGKVSDDDFNLLNECIKISNKRAK